MMRLTAGTFQSTADRMGTTSSFSAISASNFQALNSEDGAFSPSAASEPRRTLHCLHPPPQGIGEVPSDQVQSTKVIRNGTLYIIRDGRIYNAIGTRVK